MQLVISLYSYFDSLYECAYDVATLPSFLLDPETKGSVMFYETRMCKTRHKYLSITLLLTLALSPSIQAKNKAGQGKTSIIKSFEMGCAQNADYPKGKIHKLVLTDMKKLAKTRDVMQHFLAVPFDLNGDSKLEYFVVLECGSGSNCTWGIYTDKPAQSLGIIRGKGIYIHKRLKSWSAITTFSASGCPEAWIERYILVRGKYKRSSIFKETTPCLKQSDFLKRMGFPKCLMNVN